MKKILILIFLVFSFSVTAISKETTFSNEIFEKSQLDGKTVVIHSWNKTCTTCARQVKILDKAKELEAKMKESQQKIKEIRVEGVSGSNSVKITLDGEGEMQTIKLSDEILKEDKTIIEDLIVAAHNSAKSQLKSKTTEEISKATGGFGIPGFKWPL